MQWLEKIGKKLGKSASEGAIEQVKEQTCDILPIVMAAIKLIAVVAIFSGSRHTPERQISTITITNNYYGRND